MRSLAMIVALAASTGCSSLGGIELGDDGPDRFPEDDDGYGPSSATADPTRGGSEPADETSGGSSETSGAPAPDSIGHEATGGGESESSSDGGDTSDDEDPQGTSSSGSDGSTGSDGAGSLDPCAGLQLPACPPACALEGAYPCGLPCDPEVDEGYTCGDEDGAGMTCRDGVWVCFDPPVPRGECTMVCDPSASP